MTGFLDKVAKVNEEIKSNEEGVIITFTSAPNFIKDRIK
jgi:hypothetical protein